MSYSDSRCQSSTSAPPTTFTSRLDRPELGRDAGGDGVDQRPSSVTSGRPSLARPPSSAVTRCPVSAACSAMLVMTPTSAPACRECQRRRRADAASSAAHHEADVARQIDGDQRRAPFTRQPQRAGRHARRPPRSRRRVVLIGVRRRSHHGPVEHGSPDPRYDAVGCGHRTRWARASVRPAHLAVHREEPGPPSARSTRTASRPRAGGRRSRGRARCGPASRAVHPAEEDVARRRLREPLAFDDPRPWSWCTRCPTSAPRTDARPP